MNTTQTTNLKSLLQILEVEKFTPARTHHDIAITGGWDRGARTDKWLRVVIDEGQVEIFRFDKVNVLQWQARLDLGTPIAILRATLTTAVDDATGTLRSGSKRVTIPQD